MLQENNQLAEHISQVLASRQQQLEERRLRKLAQTSREHAPQPENGVESLRREFLSRILQFFSY
jgi:hypothetical protein